MSGDFWTDDLELFFDKDTGFADEATVTVVPEHLTDPDDEDSELVPAVTKTFLVIFDDPTVNVRAYDTDIHGPDVQVTCQAPDLLALEAMVPGGTKNVRGLQMVVEQAGDYRTFKIESTGLDGTGLANICLNEVFGD